MQVAVEVRSLDYEMTQPIQSLPQDVIHQISAGEVIDSWAAVVRELVENAIDAQATRLQIDFWPDTWQIRVADNGWGMSWENLQQAACPHSTSKIQSSVDLWQIHSLGFRGEALHSLCQLADVEICSRPQLDSGESGWRVTYDINGQVTSATTAAMAPGTIVTVTDLFATWPTRRAGLPKTSQQLRDVQQTIYHLALCHPHLTWTVRIHDRPWLTLNPGQTPRFLLPQMLKTVDYSDLREVKADLSSGTASGVTASGQIYGLIGLPDRCHRRRPDWIVLALNGRPITLPELEQGVLRAFSFAVPRHRYPLCFLHLTVPPQEIDWNRHPAKATLYLKHLEQWQTQITQTLESGLRLSPEIWSDATHHQRVTHLVKTAESGGQYATPNRSVQSLSDPLPATEPPMDLKAIAQVHNRYILAEHPGGICLIEQHIAHERVIYETLRQHWEVVPLATPILLERLTDAQIAQLQRLGLQVEPFGNQTWAIRTLPKALVDRADQEEALQELSLGGDLEAALVATACRTAIRNGMPLTLDEMTTLLRTWQRTQNPHTCPHGRPICLTLAETSLARFFRRHWVIGKSHGV